MALKPRHYRHVTDLIAVNRVVVMTDNGGSGEPSMIDVQLNTVVLKRPTSLQAAASSRSPTDSSRVSLDVVSLFHACLYSSGRFIERANRAAALPFCGTWWPPGLEICWRRHWLSDKQNCSASRDPTEGLSQTCKPLSTFQNPGVDAALHVLVMFVACLTGWQV